ncbi:MAG: hypothetical protein ACLFT0_12520 [Spirulinaceae cyanobacterium]
MNLNDEDVIHVPKSANLDRGTTFTVSEIKQWLHSKLPDSDDQLVTGVEAQILSATQPGGWKTGTIKLTVEFTETPQADPPPS